MNFSKLDYCQYLLVCQSNYTLTHLAEHSNWSHDTINRYLAGDQLTSAIVWENVCSQVVTDTDAYVIFDDTVLGKPHSRSIELSRYLYSSSEKRVLKGIGLVSLVYVNPTTNQFWLIDYRIYDKDGDGKSKIDHFAEMLENLVEHKQLPFRTVLMDAWYATTRLMVLIDRLDKFFCCPIRKNRKVDDSGGTQPYQSVEQLTWSEHELEQGKHVKLRKFPQETKVKLFRVTVSDHSTEYLVTNDQSQDHTDDVQQANVVRWKVEEFHREAKQLTGLEACQCRKARIQRNHIACALLVWLKLKQLAYETGLTVYQLKNNLFSDYLKQQMKSPAIKLNLA